MSYGRRTEDRSKWRTSVKVTAVLTGLFGLASAYGCLGPLGPSSVARGGNGSSLASCKSYALAAADEAQGLNLLAGVYYNGAGGIQQMVAAKCATAGCHVAGAQAPNLSTSDLLKTNYTRFLARAKDTVNIMPPASSGKARFTAAELLAVDQWKTDNFPLDATTPGATPTPTPTPSAGGTVGTPASGGPTFLKDAKPYLTAKCMTCHNSQAPKDLDKYSYVKANVETILGVMQSDGADMMPKAGKSPEGIKLLTDWQTAGMIEGIADAASNASSTQDGVCKLEELSAAQKEKYTEMKNPKDMKDCNDDKKLLYSRVSKKCVDGSELLDPTKCDLDWAKARIATSKDDVKKQFNDQIDGGYIVEQCGSIGGDSIFYLTKFDFNTMSATKTFGYRVKAAQ